LERTGKEAEILRTVKIRKLHYFRHIVRGEKYEMLRFIIQCKIEGKRGRGRPPITWKQNLKEWTDSTTVELFRVTEDIEDWNIIANVH